MQPDLATLCAAWADAAPTEIRPDPYTPDEYVIIWGSRRAVVEASPFPKAFDLHIIAGHALACIEAQGWDVVVGRISQGSETWRWADAFPHVGNPIQRKVEVCTPTRLIGVNDEAPAHALAALRVAIAQAHSGA